MEPREPEVLYEPVLLDETEDGIIYQAGAFRVEAEAHAVLAIWRAEGRSEPMAINVVPVYDSAEGWNADR